MQSVTPQLEANAKDSTKIQLVRESARKTIAEFIEDWLLQRGEWGEKKIDKITVYFRDESAATEELLKPPVETPSTETPTTEMKN
jgi:hypothetical protein